MKKKFIRFHICWVKSVISPVFGFLKLFHHNINIFPLFSKLIKMTHLLKFTIVVNQVTSIKDQVTLLVTQATYKVA